MGFKLVFLVCLIASTFAIDIPLSVEVEALGVLQASLNIWIDLELDCVLPGVTCSPTLDGFTVTGLDLSELDLTGVIPEEIFDLVNLEVLDLSGNVMVGPISASISALVELTDLDLSNNFLSGAIPVELGDLENLVNIDLSFNQLSGSIPEDLFTLPDLEVLNLENNALTGEIDVEITAPLSELLLANNRITGDLPSSIGNLEGLVELSLSNNLFTGIVPASLVDLDLDIDLIDLSENAFTGVASSLLSADINLDLTSNCIVGDATEALNPLWRSACNNVDAETCDYSCTVICYDSAKCGCDVEFAVELDRTFVKVRRDGALRLSFTARADIKFDEAITARLAVPILGIGITDVAMVELTADAGSRFLTSEKNVQLSADVVSELTISNIELPADLTLTGVLQFGVCQQLVPIDIRLDTEL